MNEYEFTLSLRVKVQAFNLADAEECVEDVFGPGTAPGVDVTDFKVVDIVEHG